MAHCHAICSPFKARWRQIVFTVTLTLFLRMLFCCCCSVTYTSFDSSLLLLRWFVLLSTGVERVSIYFRVKARSCFEEHLLRFFFLLSFSLSLYLSIYLPIYISSSTCSFSLLSVLCRMFEREVNLEVEQKSLSRMVLICSRFGSVVVCTIRCTRLKISVTKQRQRDCWYSLSFVV